MSLCQNRSTCPNTYYELGYLELNTSETCQHKSENRIIYVKSNQPILAQTYFH